MTRRHAVLALLCAGAALAVHAQPARYFPAASAWDRKAAEDLGFDGSKLRAAIDYARSNGSTWDFAKDQVPTFGRVLGPLPGSRAATNGILVRHGYIVAEFGDTRAADPVYSAAKSFLSTVAGLAVDRGLIANVNDPVARYIHDSGYDSPHNARITWKHHLQQTSEWEGSLWGKNADFVGETEFGNGRRQPREIREPGTFYEYNDVRVNRLSLSLLRLFGAPLPEVLKAGIMDPIGASGGWRWLGYASSVVDIAGRPLASVSGGTRWGGGLWMSSEDLARFGLLILNRGTWGGRQLVSARWLKEATTPGELGPDYGYLWWLNTQRKQWPSGPARSFAAIGNGSNTVWIDPEHDLVFVWRWHKGPAMDGAIQRILAAVTGD